MVSHSSFGPLPEAWDLKGSSQDLTVPCSTLFWAGISDFVPGISWSFQLGGHCPQCPDHHWHRHCRHTSFLAVLSRSIPPAFPFSLMLLLLGGATSITLLMFLLQHHFWLIDHHQFVCVNLEVLEVHISKSRPKVIISKFPLWWSTGHCFFLIWNPSEPISTIRIRKAYGPGEAGGP